MEITGARSRRLAALILVVVANSCGDDAAPPTAITQQPLTGFTLSGDPEQSNGATWSYRATVDGVDYSLDGILYKPRGAGPFPAVILSHGNGGNAGTYARNIAATMVQWGLVSIATNYTHSAGVAIGSPGTASEPGASAANVLRARKLVDLLAGLGYVDTRRVAAHGHSMGAFVTAATAGAHPQLFRAASHSAGGSVPDGTPNAAAPLERQVRTIATPYQMHHGDADLVVALSADQRLAALLTQRGTVNELHVYAGASHADVASSAAVLSRVRVWYQSHGMF